MSGVTPQRGQKRKKKSSTINNDGSSIAKVLIKKIYLFKNTKNMRSKMIRTKYIGKAGGKGGKERNKTK